MKIIFFTFLCFAFTSCAVQSIPKATPEAEKLKIVETSDNCRIIDIVIGSASFGAEFGQDLRLAMIDAKNKAARLGADSIKIIGPRDVSTRAVLSNPSGTVMVKALDCN
jgi:hypothetical protein